MQFLTRGLRILQSTSGEVAVRRHGDVRKGTPHAGPATFQIYVKADVIAEVADTNLPASQGRKDPSF